MALMNKMKLHHEGDEDYVTMQKFNACFCNRRSTIERKAKMALELKLNLPFQVENKCVHRTGKGNCRSSDDNASAMRPSTIIYGLVSWKQKDPILKDARIEKLEGMFVNEDLAAETLQRHKNQLPKLKQRRKPEKLPTSYWIN